MPLTSDAEIAQLLNEVRHIALVGASDRPERPSFEVMGVLLAHGYQVTPVNPALAGQFIHGQRVVAALADVAEPIDMVDIFRNSEASGPIVDEAIQAGATSVWMQLGVINAQAAQRAEAAGLRVVMDHCPKIELRRLNIAPIKAA
ncbi:MAG: CoA-binding protein [Alphaproteobacteria bacterium]|nr:CoA-binding protein [Alphaproteobacteria bacterium]